MGKSGQFSRENGLSPKNSSKRGLCFCVFCLDVLRQFLAKKEERKISIEEFCTLCVCVCYYRKIVFVHFVFAPCFLAVSCKKRREGEIY